MCLLGVFAGTDPKNVTGFEIWLKRDVDFALLFTGEASWADYDASVGYLLDRFKALPRPLVFSIPLIPAGASLQNAAAGQYDAHYTAAAHAIAAARREPKIYVRTGWEQNGDWMKWAAHGREAAFIGAFQRFVTCFKSVSGRFRSVWCPNIGQRNPALSYPGDDLTDVIGLDVYHQPRWDPKDEADAWTYMVTRPYGLQWHLEFSRSHGKPMAYPEWGVSTDGFGRYIDHMAEWFRMGDVLFQSYWDSDADYPGKLSGGAYPRTGAAFREAFGR